MQRVLPALFSIFVVMLMAGVIYGKNIELKHLHDNNRQLRQDNASLRKALALNREMYQALTSQRERIMKKHKALRERINQAPSSEDAPLAPLAKATLEALHED